LSALAFPELNLPSLFQLDCFFPFHDTQRRRRCIFSCYIKPCEIFIERFTRICIVEALQPAAHRSGFRALPTCTETSSIRVRTYSTKKSVPQYLTFPECVCRIPASVVAKFFHMISHEGKLSDVETSFKLYSTTVTETLDAGVMSAVVQGYTRRNSIAAAERLLESLLDSNRYLKILQFSNDCL
jgi:hypothetical protein